MKIKRVKEQKGITLIALVITIIVLLILAGVAISMLSGENGVLRQAAKAKTETEKKSEAEAIKLAATAAMTYEDHTITDQRLTEALDSKLGARSYSITPVGDGWEIGVNKTGIHYSITGNGEVRQLAWYYIEDATKITNGTQTLTIGDVVKYDPTAGLTENKSETSYATENGYDDQTFTLSIDDTVKTKQILEWRVLGTDEDGNVLIMPTTCIKENTSESESIQYLYLGSDKDGTDDVEEGRLGALNGADEVNKIASIYGYGTGAIGARSVQVEDVNKVTGYNPNNVGVRDVNQTTTGTKYGSGISLYGNKVTYKLNSSGKIEYSYPGIAVQESSYTSFQNVDGSTLKAGQSTTLTSNLYWYFPQTLTTTENTSATTGIATNSDAYKMIFTGTNNQYYWLGSSSLQTSGGLCMFRDCSCVRGPRRELWFVRNRSSISRGLLRNQTRGFSKV